MAIIAERDRIAEETGADEATGAAWQEIAAEYQSRMRAISEREVATAVADHTCRQESGYQAAFDEMNLRVQREFYDAHRTEVDAYFQALAEALG